MQAPFYKPVRDAHKDLGLYWGRQRALGKNAEGFVGGRMRSGPGGGVVALVPAQFNRIFSLMVTYMMALKDETKPEPLHDCTGKVATKWGTR